MGIKFVNEFHCIMLISGTNIRTPDGIEIERIIKRRLMEAKKDFFYGNLFGRYDLVVEFPEHSAKIAMNLASSIQEEVIRMLPEGRKICTTLVLGTPIVSNEKADKLLHYDYDEIVRIYTFFRVRKDHLSEFTRIVNEVNKTKPTQSELRIMWTDSLFQLLIGFGPCLDGVLKKTKLFRTKANGLFEETSSYAALRYGQKDGKDLAEDHIHRLKYAFIYIKLRKLGTIRDLENKNVVELSPGYGLQPRRLGGYDKIIAITRNTVFEIMSTVNEIRNENDDIIFHTSTLLLYPEDLS